MEKSMRIKAYIFDLDDTLYDEETYVESAFSNVCNFLSKEYAMDYNAMYEYCIQSIHTEGRGHTFDNLCDHFSINEDVKELVKIYRDSKPSLELYEDAKRLFKEIKKYHTKIGIITDGNTRVQDNKVKALGLYDIVDTVILTDEYKDGSQTLSKPDERVYRICLEKIGVKAEEAVYIGDNPLKDFAGAKKLGMKTVRIIREKGMFMKEEAPSKEYEADYTIHSLDELIDKFG